MGKRKLKVRGMSIRKKILFPVAAMILLICLILGAISYKKIRQGMVSMGVEQAKMAASVVAQVVDGDKIAALTPGCEDTEDYQMLLAQLRNLKKDCGITYLYTLYTDGVKVCYGVDTDESELACSVGDECDSPSYEELAEVFQGKEYVQDYVEQSEYGTLISAYFPIYDSQGKVVAVLGSDYDASSVVERLRSTVFSVILAAVLCLVAACILLNIVVNAIARSLRKVESKLYELVHNEGDLTQKLDVKTGDELEVIAEDVNELLEYMRGIMLQIASNSLKLQGSSKSVVSDLGDAQLGISDVCATMEEMSAAMEETTASLTQINEVIREIDKSIQDISAQAQTGRRFSDEMTKRATSVRDNAKESQVEAARKAEEMAKNVKNALEKSEAAKEIRVLTDNILNITQATNLLSLNASIEAARAGEAGKGFAVVAGEIGNLAKNSGEAAEKILAVSAEVTAAVDELAGETEKMMQFLEETALLGYSKLVENGQNYREDAADMDDKMQKFADASSEIRENMENIRYALEGINTAVEESANGIVNVTSTATSLTNNMAAVHKEADGNMEIAGQLNEEVGRFKLE